MNTPLNNGAAVSFKSATATVAGTNLCGRGERQFGTLTGRVNLRTKTNKRHNGRNKARCLANLTDWIIFPNVLLLLSCLRHAVARPRSTILTVKTRLALKCSEPPCPCPRGRASHSDCEPTSTYVIPPRLLQNSLMFAVSFPLFFLPP